jgi:hypothetical protein
MLRRRIVDLESAAAPVEVRCSCGVSLEPSRAEDLRRVSFPWRCAPGKEPKTYELRCRSCRRLLIVYKTREGELAMVPDQESALRQVRERTRDEIAQELDEE